MPGAAEARRPDALVSGGVDFASGTEAQRRILAMYGPLGDEGKLHSVFSPKRRPDAQYSTARLNERLATPAYDRGVRGMPMMSMKTETSEPFSGISPPTIFTE